MSKEGRKITPETEVSPLSGRFVPVVDDDVSSRFMGHEEAISKMILFA